MNFGITITGIISIFIALILLVVFGGVLFQLGDILNSPIGALPVVLFIIAVIGVIISIILKIARS